MDIDDPRLEKAREQMSERIKRYNEIMLTVIKNHLGCEQFLNELLSAASKRWKRRSCSGKLYIAQTLNLREIDSTIWQVLKSGNDLRNQIAHSIDEGKIAAKMADLRAAYLNALTPEQAKGCEDLTDTQIIILSFGLCGGYLVIAANRLKEERISKQAGG